MVEQNERKINRLERLLPEGLLVDAAWLTQHGYPSNLRRRYVIAGRLQQPARQVYQRARGTLNWEQVVVSLQTLLQKPLVVGGRTALDLQGFAHFLVHEVKQVHLYGPAQPPSWLRNLSLEVDFVYHNSQRLFSNDSPAHATTDVTTLPWGPWNWELQLSSPERAVLELLDELPDRESFGQVDALFEGLSTLSPRKLESLLARCRSIKVKRLFLFFADRHNHTWLGHIDKSKVDIGKGKRLLVRGGKLDSTYLITVPGDLHGLE